MSGSINLVSDALEYLDNNTDKYEHLFKKVKYVKFVNNENELDHSKIYLYDENKAEIYQSKYEVIGLYNNMSQTWVWAWSIPRMRKNSIYISKKILNYGIDLPSNSQEFLKTELITSRFRISNEIQLDMHAGIASYLSKQPLVYKYKIHLEPDIFKYGEDKLIDVTKIGENPESYTIYYFFLLDLPSS
jgi:hypothetical protein